MNQYQNEAGYAAPTQPTQPTYTQPNQPNIQPPNTATFNLDARSREILAGVHPELLNAMVNIAVKKFSTTEDFWNYFLRDEFKATSSSVSGGFQTPEPKEETKQKEEPAPKAGMDFSSW